MSEMRSPDRAKAARIRQAVAADCATILMLVRELAAFERLEDEVRASEEDLRRDGFGAQPRFECLIAETQAGEPLGFALFFHSYSTFEGRAGLYLEDIYLRPSTRGQGLGRRLLAELAGIAQDRGCRRLELSVLDWNPARGFYERLGFRRNNDWLGYRLAGEALETLARSASQSR